MRVGSLLILRAASGDSSGSLPIIRGDTVSVGRGPTCAVRIRLTQVPPLAARLVAEGTRVYIVKDSAADCTVLTRGSSTVPLSVGEPVCLLHNDVLAFSTRAFRFEYGALNS